MSAGRYPLRTAISDRIGAFLPGAVEIGRDGALYATTRTFADGALERIVP